MFSSSKWSSFKCSKEVAGVISSASGGAGVIEYVNKFGDEVVGVIASTGGGKAGAYWVRSLAKL